MRSSTLKHTITSAALVLAALFHGGAARAEADTFGLGTGHDGPLSVTQAGTIVNAYTQVTSAVAAGATTIQTGGRAGTFAAGQIVLVFQTRGTFATPPASGDASGLTLNGNVGRYELARVAAVTANTVTLTHGTLHAYDANVTQLVTVPEYTTVNVAAAASLVAKQWDGATGGVLAFLATGTVTNAGTISTAALGFRGGNPITSTGSPAGCAALDGVPTGGGANAGGGHKGESVDTTAFSTDGTYSAATPHVFGRGNVASGGGGGDCFNAGGGGGGHGGSGGRGGNTNADVDTGARVVGGTGGGPVSYDPATALTFGGGGGAGDDDDGLGGNAGTGGGVVWARAAALAGTGAISANGSDAVDSALPAAGADAIFSDGAGGGGAGGGVFLWLSGNADCGGITARGGGGGDALPRTVGRLYGPGGGGAGGRVLVSAGGGTCNADVSGGASGRTSNNSASGATTGGAGGKGTAGAFTAIACSVGTGACGGCVSDAYCSGATAICNTAPGATQWTCVAGTPAPYGEPPANGGTCTAGAVPTQGASTGCTNGLCDTSDGKCGYAQGTVCSGNEQCRSNVCDTDGKCGLVDGASCSASTACRSGNCTAGKCGKTTDAGTGTSSSSSSSSSSGGNGATDDGSLQGGGLGCATTEGSAQSGWLAVLGAFGFFAARGRRRRRD